MAASVSRAFLSLSRASFFCLLLGYPFNRDPQHLNIHTPIIPVLWLIRPPVPDDNSTYPQPGLSLVFCFPSYTWPQQPHGTSSARASLNIPTTSRQTAIRTLIHSLSGVGAALDYVTYPRASFLRFPGPGPGPGPGP